ncbi:hypothetical protein EYF80_024851 [Liparis tanakae]|uniref:Uncharacterized protein n=1 Tax=Liparis tanakae TaxID=230148 RepID=A0A4Z2HGI4_9TELE|nr:hypothetical protein EYF80_024851 [Liparis tanakae]
MAVGLGEEEKPGATFFVCGTETRVVFSVVHAVRHQPGRSPISKFNPKDELTESRRAPTARPAFQKRVCGSRRRALRLSVAPSESRETPAD